MALMWPVKRMGRFIIGVRLYKTEGPGCHDVAMNERSVTFQLSVEISLSILISD